MNTKDIKRLGRRLMIKYTAAQGLFWAGNLVICSCAALFLQSLGFSSSQVGLITGTGSVLTLIFQPIFTSLAEQGGRFTVRQVLMGVFSMIAVFGAFLLLRPVMAVIAVLYVLMYTFVACGVPLLNSIGMEYENLGIPMNYGLARSGGSFLYAVLSMSCGWFTSRFGVWLLVWAGIVIFACLAALIFICDKPKKLEEEYDLRHQREEEASEKGNMIQMIRENPRLQWFLGGVLSMFIGYGMLCTYMINIVGRFGGADEEMGMALGVAALIEIPGMLLANRLIRKHGTGLIMRICCISFIVKAILLVCAVNYPVLMLAQVCHFTSYGFFAPASVYFVNAIVPDKYKVSGQTALGMADMGISGILANFLGGFLIDYFSVTIMLAINLLFVLAGTVLVFVGTKKESSM